MPFPRSRIQLSLAWQYLLASLIVFIASTIVIGVWTGDQIEVGVLNRTAAVTGLYVDSIIEPDLEPLARAQWLTDEQKQALDNLFTGSSFGQGIVAFKVWSLDGKVLYSPNRLLVGRTFDVDAGLATAARGQVNADVSDLDEPENIFERQRWNRLVQVYVPVRERGTGRVIAVAEFYQLPDDLDREIASARLRSWAVVAGVSLATYLLLVGIVKRGSDTIARQQVDLREKVIELRRLLGQNERLNDRIRHAAARATTLNEQALRRIGADLHDGPAQGLALALLRLGVVEEQVGDGSDGTLRVVESAIEDALNDLRSIAAGLRLPELADLTVADAVERAARDHERLTGTHVGVSVEDVPPHVPLPIKIALFRALQEALSNATRHGGGVGVQARVWAAAGTLCMAVSDRGPGFDAEGVETSGHATNGRPTNGQPTNGHSESGHADNRRLGLAGMREQAELLGGTFRVSAAAGRGTVVELCWPISGKEAQWLN